MRADCEVRRGSEANWVNHATVPDGGEGVPQTIEDGPSEHLRPRGRQSPYILCRSCSSKSSTRCGTACVATRHG